MTSKQFAATLRISNDPLFIGEAGTSEDLETYRENLEAHLREKFNGDVAVRLASVMRPECDDAGVEQYVRELHQGDGWLQFV